MTEYDPLASLALAGLVIGSGVLNSTYKDAAHWALAVWLLFALIGLTNAGRSGEGVVDLQMAIPFYLGTAIGLVLLAWLFHAIRRAVLYVAKSFKPSGTAG